MYKIKLDNNQIQQIYKITDNADKQSKLMSVLSYLIKYTDNVTNKLTKSLSTLYKMYCRLEYRKISNCYFFKLVDLLEKHKLYTGERRKSKNRVSEIVSKKVSEIEVAETSENTSLENDFEKHNDPITKPILNTYTLDTIKTVKVAAIDLVDEVFRDLKIKSKIIKSMVISKLQNVKLDAVGAISYILKVITEKTEQYNAMRVKYAKAVAETKYAKTKNTFTAPATATRSFNNFEPREYDYDDLEKKLLGWE